MKGGCLVLVSMLLISLVNAELCAPNYVQVLEKCYRFHQQGKNWNDAQKICESEGTKLASVLDRREYQTMLDHMKKHYGGDYWTSGSLVSGIWMWTSKGSKMDLSFFKKPPKYSGNRCAVFCTLNDAFYDANCSAGRKFICEQSSGGVLPEVEIGFDPEIGQKVDVRTG